MGNSDGVFSLVKNRWVNCWETKDEKCAWRERFEYPLHHVEASNEIKVLNVSSLVLNVMNPYYTSGLIERPQM